jgi:putative methylase
MRRPELIRQLEKFDGYEAPRADREQILSPAEAGATLLYAALERSDLEGRTLADLGCGTGALAIGAALLGARTVVGIDVDGAALAIARRNAETVGVSCEFLESPVEAYSARSDTVIMNPPFGAQRRHADRPFWAAAFRSARRRIYAFSLASSRTFIADSAVARGARVEAIQPVPWRFPRTFPHHRKRSVELPVDLWVLTPRDPEDDGTPHE